MKTLSLVFDTKDLSFPGNKEKPSSPELSKRVIFLSIKLYGEQAHGGGLPKDDRALYYSLRENLDKITDDTKELELDDKVFGFIRKVFREAKLPIDRAVEAVEKNIEAVKMD